MVAADGQSVASVIFAASHAPTGHARSTACNKDDTRRTKCWTGVAVTVLENGESNDRDPVNIGVLPESLYASPTLHGQSILNKHIVFTAKSQMFYECRRCKHEEYRGILPGATCGILLACWGGVSIAACLISIQYFLSNGLGWWWLLVAPAVFVFSITIGAITLHLLASVFEWLAISLVPCKKCGSHRFKFGRTHGFGL